MASRVSGGRLVTATGRTRIARASTMVTSDRARLMKYTPAADPADAISTPASAGPPIDDTWKRLELRASALGISRVGTIIGRSASREGRLSTCPMPVTKRKPNIHSGSAWISADTERPMEPTAKVAWLATMTRRRSKRSAICPAGRNSSITGRNCATPIHASDITDPVRS